MPFRIIRDDITRVRADAIVNTANPRPTWGRGTDLAIYRAAGEEDLLAERKKIGNLSPGETVVTGAYKLPAKYIIHTVGPAWEGGNRGELETLAACYRKSLLLAETLRCKSIAFPLISTGVYGFPKDKALAIARETIASHLENSDMQVILVVFDRRAFELSESLLAGVDQFIDENYVHGRRREEYNGEGRGSLERIERAEGEYVFASRRQNARWSLRRAPKENLKEIVAHVDESFQERLLSLIDERGLTDVEVYKRANLDRKLFSKIRCSADYRPKKKTALALAIALELNVEETRDLLSRAGIALSKSNKFDLVIDYCIRNGIYNIYEVNEILFEFNQPGLGS